MMREDEELGVYDEPNETLNEVALEFAKDHHEMYETSNFGSMHFGFIWGAKWQQERSYSEEEVILLLQKALTHKDDGEIGSLITAQGEIRTANFFSWFEQFKNK